MARRILNRKELREESEAAQRVESAEQREEKAAKKPIAKRKSRLKVKKEVRLKAYWGVFNQAMNQLHQFEYSQEKQAREKAAELSQSRKTPHFVQLVKKVIEE